ncbi:hypothetical protein MSIMFB_03347 [Mycobacterium simulans]|uniref:Uncharacterized protein n=1 Tax=Mycobacterium simulans TaxID=627089 RepID=A0A7Z7ILN2_9MYCO|nr:hypothetical protein [Mycobacterium simulans]SOJ55867.1 hypothetical protein MSIMFB_03347 [Mycobacterium simulans]
MATGRWLTNLSRDHLGDDGGHARLINNTGTAVTGGNGGITQGRSRGLPFGTPGAHG